MRFSKNPRWLALFFACGSSMAAQPLWAQVTPADGTRPSAVIGSGAIENPSLSQTRAVSEITSQPMQYQMAEPLMSTAPVNRGPQNYLLPQVGRLKTYGWLDTGYVGNPNAPASHFNGPYNTVDRANEPMLNQLYLVNEVALPNQGTGIGGRVDMLWGEDYLLAQSNGLERHRDGSSHWNAQYYGVALPQAYAEIGSKELSLKAGHFYSIVGYEGLTAPSNFFYTKSYSYQFAGPFTHWGGLATWRPSDAWQFQAGLTNGWDALERTTNQLGVLAGAKYTSSIWWTSFAITTGNENNNLSQQPTINTAFTNRTRYSLLAGIQLTDNLSYVFHHWYGFQSGGAPGGGNADWRGIDQYFYYRLNRCWNVATRCEWFNDQDGTRLGLNRPSNPNKPPYVGDVVSIAKGLNYQPNSNVIFRPEMRGDWFTSKNGTSPYDDGGKRTQWLLAADVIVRF